MFWKKKEKKERVIPENASTFQKLWYGKRSRPAMILSMYMFFILILIVIIHLSPDPVPHNREPNNNQTEENRLERMKNTLLNSTFSFNYDITLGDNHIILIGEKRENYKIGFKETEDVILRFKIENGVIYDLRSDETIELEDFYGNVNSNYLDLFFIFTLINPREYQTETEDNITKYIYEEINLPDGRILNVIIYTNNQNIIRITINELKPIYESEYKEENVYILNFSNIN